jgi:hypothetical protein
MTTISFITAYAALALGFWVHALRGLSARERSRGRDRLFGLEERILIGMYALVASAAWLLLLPIYLVGWAQLAYERRGKWSQLAQWRRPRAIAGRPA